jgi:hypothetical protein
MSRISHAIAAALLSTVVHQAAMAQIALSTSSPYTQNFDAMGTSATATLPSGFRVDKPATVRTVGTFAAAVAATSLAGGANLSSSASNGIYNFGSGTTTTGPDRAVGFLSSGTATSSGNLYAQFANNTGASLTALQISYNVEKYRAGINAAGFRIQMFYSTDGSTWTNAGSSFLTSFAQDGGTVNSGYTPAPGSTTSVTNQALAVTIPDGGSFYLSWNYSVSSGATTTNAQALAVDDIAILGIANTPTNPAATGTASPSTLQAGNSTLLTVAVTPGLNPTSSGIGLTADLTTIGGSASQQFFDDGTHGDAVANDNTFSFQATVPANTASGGKTLAVSVTDAQSRSASASIALTVTPLSTLPTGTGSANPNSLQAGGSTLLTVAVAGGTNPLSTVLAVTADLSLIGGSATQQFFDNGTNGDATTNDNVFSFLAAVGSGTAPGSKSLPVTISDAESRASNTSISLTVQSPPAPSTVKISQVYGGGGNSGSTYTNDFIEVYNQSTSPVDISQWSIQTASATVSTWNITNLCPVNGSCILQPGHYYLIQEAQGAGGTTPLPAADITGAINMGATSGKIALVASTTVLSGLCPTGSGIADMFGYGGAGTPSCFETAPIAALSNTTAGVRKGNGCVDTDNNSNDFVVIGPIPRNSSAPANICGGNPTLPSGVGTASPPSVDPAGNLLLTVTVTPATSPASTGLAVTGNLTSIGGSATQQFFDDGTNGDQTPGDNVFSFRTAAPIATGVRYITTTITDTQSRSAPAPITITVQSPTCGVERWSVKVGTDPDAGLVNLSNPIRSSISALRVIPAPASPPLNSRVAPTETTVYLVNGMMTFYKLEDDVDYHIVLQDPVGNTIITEIPSPACDGTTSPFDAAVAAVRAKFDARFTATPTFQNANLPVQMKGVGFFDFIHGQTGVAPNGIELHPILDITFTAPSTTVLSSDSNPSTYGQPVNITATVGIGSGTPSGNVSFFEGSKNLLGTAAIGPNGQATFTTSSLIAGIHTITASFEGDSQAAESSSAPFVQNVNQATPVITWPQPAAITYGGALGSGQLNATSAVPGSFSYNPAAGTVLPVGNGQTLAVIFTPSSSNYVAAAKSVTIDVLPASGGGSPANLVVTRTLARDGGGNVVATLTIANTGGTAAQNATLSVAKIGTFSGSPLPQSLGTVAPGGSVQTTITFPGTVGAPGVPGSLTLSGSYTGGTFGSSARITLP